MVSVGGLTRLTKSGLSMVEWKPTTVVPPRTEEEWTEEFEKYKLFPEYQRVNNQMSLDDFKFIYRMEFYHRLLGRAIGVVFAVPALYFLARGRINRALGARLSLAFVLGGAQGAIGWWMVKSGLDDPHQTQQSGSVHVSPYRLATHLISAFAIYALLLSTAMRVHPSTFRHPARVDSSAAAGVKALYESGVMIRLRRLAAVTTGVVALTVFSGAFVAGNEAGLVYNEFPLMGDRFIPTDFFSPYIEPKWRNAFENATTVQWNHRVLAMSTTALSIATFVVAHRLPRQAALRALQQANATVAEHIRRINTSANALVGMVAIQVSLGIATLLMYVPIPLAATHQAGSLTLLSIALWLMHCIRRPAALFKIRHVITKAALKP